MKTMNILKVLPGGGRSRVGHARGILLRWWLALLVCAAGVTALHATPVISNNDGYFFDDYPDISGIAPATQVRIAPPGTVSLTPLNLAGNYRTVAIVPTSFAQWGQLTIVGTYGALNDLMAEVLDQNGNPLIPPMLPQPVNVPINLSGLNPAVVTGLRVKVHFNKTAVVAPTVDSLRVTWRPVSQVLLDKQAPPQVPAGDKIVYGLRYSVNYVEARGLVVWDTLPAHPGSVTYPSNYGQTDNPTYVFGSATKGGLYTLGGTTVNGVIVPPNSVYWDLGDVPEGTTDQLNFTVLTKNGTLDGTTVANRARANAANAAPAQSQLVVTTIHSAPSPFLDKQEAGGIFNINEELQTSVGKVNSFKITAQNKNNSQSVGAETMYNTVVYDDVSDLMNMIEDLAPLGVREGDFFNISAGGTFISNYDPPGPAPIIPAIVWNVGTFAPGAQFVGSFSVKLLNPPPEMQYDNRACLISDRTSPTCDQMTVKLPLDEGTGSGAGGAGFKKTASLPFVFYQGNQVQLVPYGGTVAFNLSMKNKFVIKLNDVLLMDKVPANTTFNSAWFNDANLIASDAKIFYSTSVLFANRDNPPPVDYTQAVLDDLDTGGNDYWKSYAMTPPANPAAVTWVAFYIPQVDSVYLPDLLPTALSPSTPITSAVGSFDVKVLIPADPCTDTPLPNRGIFRAYEITDFSGTKQVNPNGTLSDTADAVVIATGYKGSLSASASISPDPVSVPGVSTYTLTVRNDNSATSDALANVMAELQLSQVAVNGVLQYPSVQSIPAGGYPSGLGQITVPLGLMARGASRTIQMQLGLPAGILGNKDYTVTATVTGQDDQCGTSTTSTTARGTVQASPRLQINKHVQADLIPSGGTYEYTLNYQNLGTAPSTKTWIVDRVPNLSVFVQAKGNPNITAVYFSDDVNLPPPALTPLMPINDNTINTHFTRGAHLAGEVWTSPFGDQTRWVAWLVDDSDPALGLPQFVLNTLRTVGFTVRNDDNGPLAGTAGSPQGAQVYNSAGIFSSELLQAIGNQVITTINDQPSIIVSKTGPSSVEAGVPFDWVVTYHNDTLATPDNTVVITDTLPPGVHLVAPSSVTHTWNVVAVANGAPVNNSFRPLPTSSVVNGDGSTTLTFNIAGPTGYRGNGIALAGLEGGTLTLRVQADSTTASGTTRQNGVCGTATTGSDVATSCASHQVTIFRPDLELLKYVAPAEVLAGGNLTYQLVVANHGPIPARNVTLTDILPAGVSYVSGSLIVLTPGYTLAAPTISGQTLTWNTANGNALTRTGRPAGEVPGASGNILIQFTAHVGSTVPGCTTLNNVAQVTTVSAEEVVYANDASATATVPPPDLAVAKSGPDLARPGNRVSWNITWVNQSLQGATGVYLVDTLPNDGVNSTVTFDNVTVSGATPYYNADPSSSVPAFDPNIPVSNGWSATPPTRVNHLALLVGALAGNTGPFTAEVSAYLADPDTHVLPPPGTSFTNTVVINQAVPLCENILNNTATAVTRTPALDVALTKTASIQGAIPGLAPGQPITYTLAFENKGTVNAYGILVTDTLPTSVVAGNPLDNFTVVALVDAGGNPVNLVDLAGDPIVGAVPVTREVVGSVIKWYLGTTTPSDALYYQNVGLPPESKGSFQLYATIAESATDNTEVCNSATVVADVGTEDVLDNNSSQSCTTVHRADVAIRKFGAEVPGGDPDFVEFGNQVQYTIEYNNLGSFDAQNVSINEIVPVGTSLVGVNPPPGATVTYSPSLADATSFTVHFNTLPAPANSVGFPQNLNGPAPSTGAQPVLHIELLGNTNVLITWDTAYTGFSLEQNNSVVAPNGWTPVLSPVRLFPGNQQGVSLPVSQLFNFFFRLRQGTICSPGVHENFANANPAGFLGWKTLYVNDTIPAGASILYSVGRQNGAAIVYDLGPSYTSVSVGPNGLSLSGINPAYTDLVLKAVLTSTGGSNGVSPCLNAWQMTYDSSVWPSFTFTVRVDGRNADSCGPLRIDNSVSITTTTPEITLANNTASDSLNTRLTDLAVQMLVDKAAVLPAEILTYVLPWSVAGPQGAPAAYLQIVLPGAGVADVTLGTVTPGPGVTAYYSTASTLSSPVFNPSNPIGWTFNKAGANHVVFLLGDRAPNSSGIITYTASVKAGTAGRTLISCVAGRTARRETDCDNSACTTTVVGTFANVHVEKTGPSDCVNPGEQVSFTITYGNNGNAAAANVVVADVLPPGLTFESSMPAPTGPGPVWNNLGTTPGSLAAGETGVITLIARLANDCTLVGKTLGNVATISTTTAEVNLADNRAQADLDCIIADFVSLSGYVYRDGNQNGVRELGLGETGLKDVTITLTGTDWCGNPLTLITLTDQNGQYSFIGLNPGTYTLTETQPANYISTADTVGTPRGNPLNNPLDDVLDMITLFGGEVGQGYNFGEKAVSTAPLLTCATNKTVECGTAWIFDPPTATNACCANVTLIILSTVTNSTGPCQMIITRTWQATDCCTNTGTCEQTVTVVDTTPPTISCSSLPPITNCLAAVPSVSVVASDNCTTANALVITQNPPAGSLVGPGTYPVLVTVFDACGNSNSCSATLTVTAPPPDWSWITTAGGTATDAGYAIARDPDGNVYVTGWFASTVTFGATTLTSTGGGDVFIAKLDPAGNFLWAKQAGGAGSDLGSAIGVDSSGNVYVTGNFSATATFGAYTLNGGGGFVTKLDTFGNFLWARAAGPYVFFSSLAVDAAGNSYLAGTYCCQAVTLGTTTLPNPASDHIFVAKLDSAGNFVWADSAPGSASAYVGGIARDGTGNVYLTGYFKDGTLTLGTTTLTTSSANVFDLFVTKLDGGGNFLWATQGTGGADKFGRAVAVDATGANVYVTGSYSGAATFGATALNAVGGSDIFVARLDGNGAWLWVKSAGGAGTDFGNGIGLDGAGNVYVAGGGETGLFGSLPFNAVGNVDAFVTQMDAAGNFLWVNRYGGMFGDAATGITVAANGCAYVTGYFVGAASTGPKTTSLTGPQPRSTSGSDDIFSAKVCPPCDVSTVSSLP